MTSKDILQGDFLKFLWYVWTNILALPAPDRIQLDIGRYLAGGPSKRFIQAFRGVGKSFLTCAYVVWRLWKEPNLKVLIVSAGEDLAVENASLIQQIIYHPAGDELWAELRGGRRSSTLAFDVGNCVPDKSPSVKCAGITGQITGSRSDILISDDVEVPKNSETETQRDKLRRLTGEYGDIAKPGSEIIYLGTPQSMESIYKGLPERGYDVRIWPARYPLASRLGNYLGTLAPLLLADIEADPDLCKDTGTGTGGAPTNPVRFNELELIRKEAERGKAGFLLQYQLDTSLADADRYPLKTRDLIVTDVDRKVAPMRLVWGSGPDQIIKDPALPNVGFDGDRLCRPVFTSPEFSEFTGSVMHIDPSGRGKDRTAYVVTKFLNGYVFIRRWGGFPDGYSPETLQRIAEIAAEEEVNLICTEDNFGDGMFARLLEPVVARRRPTPVEGYKVSGQKEVRILNYVRPTLEQHRLVLDATVARMDLAQPDTVHRGLYQLTHLTDARGALRHDDLIDVLAQALAYWTPYMNADALKAEETWKRKQEEEFEREFFAGTIIGAGLGKPTGQRRAPGRNLRGTRRGTWGRA